MKTPLILSLALIAALASAQTVQSGTRGRGEATAADGRMAKFEEHAFDREGAQNGVRLEGLVHFEQIANGAGPMVHIHMEGPDFVKVNGNVCDYSGEGRLKTMVQGKERTIHGKVEVEVVNNHKRSDGKTGTPDTFDIRFKGKDGLTFRFAGALVKGNLGVYTHEKG